jgi:uncharacterized protein involved in exopolysaccharide biosynthesis
VILVAVAVATGSAAWTLRQPRIYRATATVLINQRPPATLDKVNDVLTTDYWGEAERFINSQIRLLQSREMADRAAARVGLSPGSLVGRLEVAVEKTSQLAMLSIEDRDPAAAQQLANTFMNVYVESTIDDRTTASAEASRFLGSQARSLRKRLEEDEKAL